MIRRLAEGRILSLAEQFPVVVVTGPRQSGKTTLAKALFPDRPYLNLERPDTLDRMRADPFGTLRALKDSGAIIDEAQRFPELTSWLQATVDEDPQPGKWILTGSNQPQLRQSVSQSLAGRSAYARLYPFCLAEVEDSLRGISTDEVIAKGWYPPLYDRGFIPSDWYEQYVATYLERDLSQLIRVRDLSQFRKFLALCAGRTAQVLNLSDLARDTGTSHTTIREWLSVLENSFLVYFLQPYHANFQKRIVKSPKFFFIDVGLAAWLIGIRDAAQVATHPLRGPLFETLVLADALKEREAGARREDFYFWNAPSLGEVDLVRVEGSGVRGTEIKSTATFRPALADTLLRWGSLAGIPEGGLDLVYDGEESFQYKGAFVHSWRKHLPPLE